MNGTGNGDQVGYLDLKEPSLSVATEKQARNAVPQKEFSLITILLSILPSHPEKPLNPS